MARMAQEQMSREDPEIYHKEIKGQGQKPLEKEQRYTMLWEGEEGEDERGELSRWEGYFFSFDLTQGTAVTPDLGRFPFFTLVIGRGMVILRNFGIGHLHRYTIVDFYYIYILPR